MKSDIGSAIIDLVFSLVFVRYLLVACPGLPGSNYQEDFRTPGISPSFAASRKQARHIPKSRINERLRPQRKQRRTTREANFGVRALRAIVDFLAILYKNEPSKGSKEYTRDWYISQIELA